MAASVQAPQQEGAFSFIMIIAIFVLFYFMLIRPQNKRAKEQRNLVDSIQQGDEIATSGGIIGKIVDMKDNYVKVTIADNVEITLQKSSISTVLPKNTIKSMF